MTFWLLCALLFLLYTCVYAVFLYRNFYYPIFLFRWNHYLLYRIVSIIIKTLKNTLNYQTMIIIEAEDTVLCLAHHIINALIGMQKSQKKERIWTLLACWFNFQLFCGIKKVETGLRYAKIMYMIKLNYST